MAYGAMRHSQVVCGNRSRCAARQPTAMTVSTAPTNSNWPISTPTLKNSSAIGIADCGKPTSASAPAKPNPCISPLAGVAEALASAAVPFPDFVLTLLRQALRRGPRPDLAHFASRVVDMKPLMADPSPPPASGA